MRRGPLRRPAVNRLFRSGPLLVLAAAILWGTSGTAQELAPVGASGAVVGAARLMLCALFLAVISLARGRLYSLRLLLRPALLAAGGIQALFHVTYFGGIARTGVTVGTLVAVGSTPVFAGLLGRLLDGEHFSRTWLAATAMALAGLALLLFSAGEAVEVRLEGIHFAMTAGFSYTLFTWITRRLIGELPVETVLTVSFLIGSVLLLPVLASEPLAWIRSVRGIQVVLYLGLISAGIAYLLYGYGLRSVPLSSVGTLALAEPLTASVLGIFLLHEAVTPPIGVGIALLFTGQLIIVLRTNTAAGTSQDRPSA